MKLFRAMPLVSLLSACGGSANAPVTEEAIWDNTSQRIVVVQDNGNTPNADDRYVIYDYSKDLLTVEAIAALPTIKVIKEPLSCVNDAVTYEITITNEQGLDQTYYSNNMSCNEINGKRFVATDKIEALIPMFFTYQVVD